jgi:hypothetical protein
MIQRNLLLYGLLLLASLMAYPVCAQSFKLSFTSNSRYSPFIFATSQEGDKKADSFYYNSRLVLEAALRIRSVPDQPGQSFTQLILTPNRLLVSDEGLSQEPDTAEAVRFLSKPVYLRRNDSGRVVQVYFDTTVTSTYRQLWNQLIAYMQFIAPKARQEATAWDITEEDRIGFFHAHYEQLKADGQTANRYFRKKGAGYTSFSSQGIADYVQRLEANYLLNNDQLSAIALNELIQLKVKGKIKAVTSSTFRLNMDTAASISNPEEDSLLVRRLRNNMQGTAAVTLNNFVTRQEIRSTMYRQVLAQQTMQDVLQSIDTLTIAEAKADKDRINRKVAALVYLYPALVDSFMQRIAEEPPSSPAFRIIIKGFVQAATPTAQERIGLLLHRYQDNPAAIDFFTNALLFVEGPDANLIASIQNIAYDQQSFDAPVKEALRYLLGSFSHSLKNNDPAASTAVILNTLAAIKKDSRKPEREKIMELLGVAGNAGGNVTFVEVSSYVTNRDTDIRVQALFALRLIDTAAVDALLLRDFTSDTSAGSRTIILNVFRYRSITRRVIDAVATMLPAAQDESLAINGARLLYENRKAFPEVTGLLKKIAEQTTNTNLKKEISTLFKL